MNMRQGSLALAVEREHLKVDTVFAMHQARVPWSQVLALLDKSKGTG